MAIVIILQKDVKDKEKFVRRIMEVRKLRFELSTLLTQYMEVR